MLTENPETYVRLYSLALAPVLLLETKSGISELRLVQTA